MNKMRRLICGTVLTLTLSGGISYAADVLKPNTPSLTSTTTTTETVVTPAPTAANPGTLPPATPGSALTSKPADTLLLSTTPAIPAMDPKDIPDIVMKEMQEIQKNCERNYFYSSFHDCKCVAVKFLDARMKSDPDVPKERIFTQIAGQCVDEPSIAGYIYKSCADYMQHTRPSDYVSFCRCSANDVAKSYTKAPVMNLRYIEGLRRNAFVKCGIGNNPDRPSSGGVRN